MGKVECEKLERDVAEEVEHVPVLEVVCTETEMRELNGVKADDGLLSDH